MSTRLTSPTTINILPDKDADRRLTTTEGLEKGQRVEHLSSGRTVKIKTVGSDWILTTSGMTRKVYCFGRVR